MTNERKTLQRGHSQSGEARAWLIVAPEERLRLTIEICARISCGESVRHIFAKKRPKDYPDRVNFWRWRAADPELAALFQQAVDERILLETEEMVALADQVPPKVAGKVDQGWVMWQRGRIDVRKWNAARRQVKLYGDKTVLSNDPDNPIPPLLVIGGPRKPDDDAAR